MALISEMHVYETDNEHMLNYTHTECYQHTCFQSAISSHPPVLQNDR